MPADRDTTGLRETSEGRREFCWGLSAVPLDPTALDDAGPQRLERLAEAGGLWPEQHRAERLAALIDGRRR